MKVYIKPLHDILNDSNFKTYYTDDDDDEVEEDWEYEKNLVIYHKDLGKIATSDTTCCDKIINIEPIESNYCLYKKSKYLKYRVRDSDINVNGLHIFEGMYVKLED